MDTIEDLNKLTTFLNNTKDIDSSDLESIDSVEITHDYKRLPGKIHEPCTSHYHNTLWQRNGECHNANIQKFVNSCTDLMIKNAVSNEIVQHYERLEDKRQESSNLHTPCNNPAQSNRDESCSSGPQNVVETLIDSVAENVVSNDVQQEKLGNTLSHSQTSITQRSTTDKEQEIIDSCTDPVLAKALLCNVEKRRILKQLYQQFQTEKLNENTASQSEDRAHRCSLGIPYFKDKFCFPSRPNEDFIKLKRSKQLLSHRKNPMRRWTGTDKNKLAKAVYKEICRKKLAQINEEIMNARRADNEDKPTANTVTCLIKERNCFGDTKLVEKLAATWMKNSTVTSNANQAATNSTISIEVRCKRSAFEQERLASETLIIQTVGNWADIDWNRMSAQVLNGRHSETECRAEWTCYMNPRFCKRPWTQRENETLRTLARKYNYQNWQAMGSALNRSALQCCVHFQTRLCGRYNRDRWTKQEDDMLRETIKLCVDAEGDIQWGSVAYFFKNRTKGQIYNRYTYCLVPTIKKGPFSIAEDVLLVVLARLFKNNFTKIRAYFPDRQLPQLRSHFFTMRTNSLQQWTVEEDAKVIEHVQVYGTKHWSKLKLQRSTHCVRHRYLILRQWFETHPDGKLQDIKRRKLSSWHTKKERRNGMIDVIVAKLWTQVQSTTDQQQRNACLSISHIDGLLKQVPDYKKPRCAGSRKSKVKTGTIDEKLKDFFKPTFRFLGRTRSIITSETVHEATNRTELILEVLQANLKLPSLDQVAGLPALNDLDKRVLEQLIIRRKKQQATVDDSASVTSSDNAASTSQMQCLPVEMKDYTFPVNAETLIGFRSLLLHYSTLVQHSKFRYDGYISYLDKAMNQMYVARDAAAVQTQMATYMHIPADSEHRVQIKSERQLFTSRFFQLFKWACFMCENKMVPGIEPAVRPVIPIKQSPIEISIEQQKPGRPKKKGNYKVELMNIARNLKRQQTNKNTQENLDQVEYNSGKSNTSVVEQDNLEPAVKKAKTTKRNVKKNGNENGAKTVRKTAVKTISCKTAPIVTGNSKRKTST